MLRFTFSPNGLYKVINLYLTFVSTCRIAVRHTGLPCELTPCDFTSSPRFDGGIERHFSLCLGCTFRFLFQSFCADGSKESLTKICTAFYVVLFRVRSRSACLSFGHGCSLSSYGFCPTVRLPEHCQHFTLGNLVRQGAEVLLKCLLCPKVACGLSPFYGLTKEPHRSCHFH